MSARSGGCVCVVVVLVDVTLVTVVTDVVVRVCVVCEVDVLEVDVFVGASWRRHRYPVISTEERTS